MKKEKGEVKRTDPPGSEERRGYLKTVGTLVVGLAVGGAVGWLSKPAERITETITKTVTKTTPTGPIPWAKDKFKGEKVTFFMMSGTYIDHAKAVKAGFEEITGAELEIIDAPWVAMHEKIVTDFVTGAGEFDVIGIAGWLNEFSKHVVDLEPYINEYEVDTADFLPGIWRHNAVVLGKTLAIPYTATAATVQVYRRDLFEEAGITWPTTWDEYLNAVKTLTDEEKGIYGMTFAGNKYQLCACSWMQRFYSLGGDFYDNDWNVIVNKGATRDAGVESLNHLKECVKYCPLGVEGFDIPENEGAFLAGDAAIFEGWTLFLRGKLDDPEKSKVIGKYAYGISPLNAPHVASWAFGIPKTSKNKDLAFALLQYLTSREVQKIGILDVGVNPARYSVYQDPEVLAKVPVMNQEMGALENYKEPYAGHVLSSEIFEIASSYSSKGVFGILTPEEALDQMADDLKTLVEENPPEEPYYLY